MFCNYLYADILGFRSMLTGTPLPVLGEKITAAIGAAAALVDERQVSIQNARAHPVLPQFFGWASEGTFSLYFAFDTVIVFHKDISSDAVIMDSPRFLQMCSALYLSLLAGHGIKIRGVVGLTQDYLIEKDILLIKELGRAFELEKNQNWSGLLVDTPALERWDWNCGTRAEDEIIFYAVPTKRVLTELPPVNTWHEPNEYPVLNPVNKRNMSFLQQHGWSLKKIIEDMKAEAESPVVSDVVQEKLRNTCAFLEHAKDGYEHALMLEQRWESHIVGPVVP